MSDSRMESPPAAGAAGAEIRVNGEPVTVPESCTVRRLLEIRGLAGQRVAVAVGREVVPRSRHDEVLLAPGDRVEILEAVGGG